MHASDLPTTKPIERHWNAKIARRMLEAFESSGMSREAFARSRGVNPQRLWWWRKRLAERPSPRPISFIPAAVSHVQEAAGITVRLPGGVAIEAKAAAASPVAWVTALARSLAGCQ
jgi:hypothetical protein